MHMLSDFFCFQHNMTCKHCLRSEDMTCLTMVSCVYLMLRFALSCLPIWRHCLNTCGHVTCVQSSWIWTLMSLSVWNVANATRERSVHATMGWNTARCGFIDCHCLLIVQVYFISVFAMKISTECQMMYWRLRADVKWSDVRSLLMVEGRWVSVDVFALVGDRKGVWP